MSRERYDAEEETLYVPVDVSEVDRLYAASGRPLLDKYAIKHFLYRVRHTLAAGQSSVQELTKALDIANERKRRHGTPTTLTPMDAVKFASPDELAVIVGNISSNQIKALQATIEDAKNKQQQLSYSLDSVRVIVQQAAVDPNIPEPARARLADLLNSLPQPPEPIVEPKTLELARASGMLDSPEPLPAPVQQEPLALEAAPSIVLTKTLAPTRTLAQYTTLPPWVG